MEAKVHKEAATTPPTPEKYEADDAIEARRTARDAGIEEYNKAEGGSPLTEADVAG